MFPPNKGGLHAQAPTGAVRAKQRYSMHLICDRLDVVVLDILNLFDVQVPKT